MLELIAAKMTHNLFDWFTHNVSNKKAPKNELSGRPGVWKQKFTKLILSVKWRTQNKSVYNHTISQKKFWFRSGVPEHLICFSRLRGKSDANQPLTIFGY
jgi:hypothetical protein